MLEISLRKQARIQPFAVMKRRNSSLGVSLSRPEKIRKPGRSINSALEAFREAAKRADASWESGARAAQDDEDAACEALKNFLEMVRKSSKSRGGAEKPVRRKRGSI